MTSERRRALLGKYRQLARWRAARDAGFGPRLDAKAIGPGASPGVTPFPGAEPANRAAMRALSEDFPGCLRELDVLGASEIARRITILQETSGAIPPWVNWIDAYHRLMRAALTTRRRMSRADRLAGLSPAQVAELRQIAAAITEPADPIDDPFIHAVAAPPAGRLSPVVLGILAKQFGVPAPQISTTLFPPRRPSR